MVSIGVLVRHTCLVGTCVVQLNGPPLWGGTVWFGALGDNPGPLATLLGYSKVESL